ncbi:L-aspartate oxidase [Cryomorpha ignava]|uniref:L-aspartate oxidase n=1 Tax=Cryomorpha ignava TaxID=101383 RepID=A0A7K3WUX8_9FLAO|nr:L-aspartate oxidase [Cryomorpha ignava]NEN25296.1 L-aspartate oxidase [Cryomorpha ignava]
MQNFDYLVIGSGIAGLTFALKVAQHKPHSKVCIVTKANENESNTKYAQGGIAVVLDTILDSYQKHIDDTLKAGDGLCDRNVVEIVVTEGSARLRELIDWGVRFDKNGKGDFHLGLEGGHSQNRILHHNDITGFEIEKNLLIQIHRQSNIQLFSSHLAIDLLLEKDSQTVESKCSGALILNTETGTAEVFRSSVSMLATGGVGQVYGTTTNSVIATGDGIAMANRVGAKIQGMEFIQFHPTALKHGSSSPSFLISEAVRGSGAYLVNANGERFMVNYDSRLELASRDIVSRAIYTEIKNTGSDCVYLDCRHLDKVEFENHFPNIAARLKSEGIDVSRDLIPVAPAAHYLCGGIDVDVHGQTSISGLMACGECAHTGLHGGNRLASNSLLEAVVFAHRSYLKAIEIALKPSYIHESLEWFKYASANVESEKRIAHWRKQVQNIMDENAGINRMDKTLQAAKVKIKSLEIKVEKAIETVGFSLPLIELRNLIVIATMIVDASLERNTNKGTFFKIEFDKVKILA